MNVRKQADESHEISFLLNNSVDEIKREYCFGILLNKCVCVFIKRGAQTGPPLGGDKHTCVGGPGILRHSGPPEVFLSAA